jgi:hypothetical protein
MPIELQHASLAQLALGVVLASLIVSLILGFALKLVGESVFKHKVRYLDAFKAMFVATLVLLILIFALMKLDAINVARSGGIALQIIGLIVGVVILAFTITFFVRSPTGLRPDFAKSGVVAAIMQVISLMIALVFTSINLPIKGVYMDPARFKTVETRT